MFFLSPSIVVIPVISEQSWWCFYEYDDYENGDDDEYDDGDDDDYDDDVDDDTPAEPAMTGLVGPFPPPADPLLYWNSTQAFHDDHHEVDDEDGGKGWCCCAWEWRVCNHGLMLMMTMILTCAG